MPRGGRGRRPPGMRAAEARRCAQAQAALIDDDGGSTLPAKVQQKGRFEVYDEEQKVRACPLQRVFGRPRQAGPLPQLPRHAALVLHA